MHFFGFELANIIPWLVQWGYLGVAGALFIEGLSIPFPGGTILLLYGFLASQGNISMPLTILFASLAYTVASTLPYYIGKIGGRPLILKYGRYFGLSDRYFSKIEYLFSRFGNPVVALCRLMFFRNYISYFAGITKMPPISFYFYTWIGVLPWVAWMSILGYILGNNWPYAFKLIKQYSWLGLIAIAMIAIIAFILFKFGILNRFFKWMGSLSRN